LNEIEEQVMPALAALSALAPYRPYFDVILVILGVALIASILMQARGAGLGSVFGGTGTVFKTRRGIEKLLFRATIFFGALFCLMCFLTWLVPAPTQ
jgi:preprotein translocase subunit SecG